MWKLPRIDFAGCVRCMNSVVGCSMKITPSTQRARWKAGATNDRGHYVGALIWKQSVPSGAPEGYA